MLESYLLFCKSEIMDAFSLSAEKPEVLLNWYLYSLNVEFHEKKHLSWRYLLEVCDTNFHLYTV